MNQTEYTLAKEINLILAEFNVLDVPDSLRKAEYWKYSNEIVQIAPDRIPLKNYLRTLFLDLGSIDENSNETLFVFEKKIDEITVKIIDLYP